MRATRAIIHIDNFRHNIRAIRSRIGSKVKICVAAKADAYGHGALGIARAAILEGVEFLGVATSEEGCELACAGIKAQIILLSVPLAEEIPSVLRAGIIPIIPDERLVDEIAREASRQGKKACVHLKIDTGMGRLGIAPCDALKAASKISENKNLVLSGICTHLSASDAGDALSSEDEAEYEKVPALIGGGPIAGAINAPASDTKAAEERLRAHDPGSIGAKFTLVQLAAFKEALERIRNAGIDPGIVHAANSGAVIAWPELYFDMVRPGILAYGYYPSRDQERKLGIKPVMELVTKVVFMKKVEKGTPISYGMTYAPKRDTVIATLPVGYGDGYSRLLSNRSSVLIKGKRYPVVGRVCMDHTMVDLGPEPDVRLFDDAMLFGPGESGPDAEEIARLMGTIPYEVTCLITKRVPRVFA